MDDLVFETPQPDPPEPVGRDLTLDGKKYPLYEPKQAALVRMADSSTKAPIEQVRASLACFWQMLGTDKARAEIQARLDDPKDHLDSEYLVVTVIPGAIAAVSKRPTQPSSASSRQRRPTKKASTGASRSKASTRRG